MDRVRYSNEYSEFNEDTINNKWNNFKNITLTQLTKLLGIKKGRKIMNDLMSVSS